MHKRLNELNANAKEDSIQISCDEVKEKRVAHEEETYNGPMPCGQKNPST